MNNHDARVYAMRALFLGTDVSKLSARGWRELTAMLAEVSKALERNEKLQQDRNRHSNG